MTDLTRPMNLDSKKGRDALEIVKKLCEAGYDAVFAGGCVRDHLLQILPMDYDIATSATPEQVEKLFKKTIPVGRQFGVMLVLLDGIEFEVATFRTEGGYQDGRRPGFVHFSNAQEDASRRDFTVNGLFYTPLDHKVLDYVGGISDIQKKTIRCIGEPAKRFEEDKLRLLRAIRFAVKLDFNIDAETWNEIKKRASQIQMVSMERIGEELTKIFTSKHSEKGLRLLADSGLWRALWSDIPPDETIFRRFHNLHADINLANACFYWGCTKAAVEQNLRRLRFSNDVIRNTVRILEISDELKNFSQLRPGKQKLLAADIQFLHAKILYSKMESPQNLILTIEEITCAWVGQPLPKPFLGGEDLKQLGIGSGPQLGKILEEIYLLQLEGQLKDRGQALAQAQKQI